MIRRSILGFYIPSNEKSIQITVGYSFKVLALLIDDPKCWMLNFKIDNVEQTVSSIPAEMYALADYDRISRELVALGLTGELYDQAAVVALARFNLSFQTIPAGHTFRVERTGDDLSAPLVGSFLVLSTGPE